MSAVVPATDTPATLDRCRAALAASDRPPDELIVVDGPAELSAAAARNAGAVEARGDVLLFVDADVEVHRDALTRIRDAFGDDSDLAAVFGSYDDRPSASGRVSVFRNLLHHHVHHHGAGPAETFWTGLGAIRTSVFADVGGFDEDRYRHASIEDIELGDRLRRGGHRIVLDPAIQGTHLKAWTLRSMVRTDFARRGVPWVALQVGNRRMSAALNLGWRHRVSALACVVACA
ncbi:MAG TPA: glycosyltransferase, partial [Micromonosporaceae bacterium]|nr:glycosyltransferase [Micromonosporaceae bacterium]